MKCCSCNREIKPGRELPVYSGGMVPIGMACCKECANAARGAKVAAPKPEPEDKSQREMFK